MQLDLGLKMNPAGGLEIRHERRKNHSAQRDAGRSGSFSLSVGRSILRDVTVSQLECNA